MTFLNRVALRPSYLARAHNRREARERSRPPTPPLFCPAETALRQAVLAAPEADKLRLVYADWLGHHGEPERAEFIRVQLALARSPDDAERDRLEAREAALLRQHGKRWLAEVEPWAPAGCRFRRGFVEE